MVETGAAATFAADAESVLARSDAAPAPSRAATYAAPGRGMAETSVYRKPPESSC
jgi:hypothetical protein